MHTKAFDAFIKTHFVVQLVVSSFFLIGVFTYETHTLDNTIFYMLFSFGFMIQLKLMARAVLGLFDQNPNTKLRPLLALNTFLATLVIAMLSANTFPEQILWIGLGIVSFTWTVPVYVLAHPTNNDRMT